MRTIIQRVTKASVTVGDELISSIGRGLCILVGISKDDTPKEREYIVRKILNLRLFDDENDKRWAKSVRDKQLEILCVSQFTLYSILKGNKPDFHQAMPGDQSQIYYNEFLDMLREDYHPDKIKDGQFGAHMQVHIQNDGPVTIQLDSPPDSGMSTGQESAGNADLLRHSRQDLVNLKRKYTELPANTAEFAPSHSKNVQLENSDGYLACCVCSSGLSRGWTTFDRYPVQGLWPWASSKMCYASSV
nr:D-aminoacyl-tRNA deacylase-like [Lytechinus pictus]